MASECCLYVCIYLCSISLLFSPTISLFAVGDLLVLGGGCSHVLGFPTRLLGFVCENVPRKKGRKERYRGIYRLDLLLPRYITCEPYDC